METNTLCNRHIGPDENDVKKMLEKIGVELFIVTFSKK
jgi:glycine cleavage system pyridoxal-binding protein P